MNRFLTCSPLTLPQQNSNFVQNREQIAEKHFNTGNFSPTYGRLVSSNASKGEAAEKQRKNLCSEIQKGSFVCNHNLHAVLGALPHLLGENPYQHGATVNVCNFQHENGQKSTCSKHRASVKYHLLVASLRRHCFLKGTFEKPF